jgi:hypothetical protein
LLPSLPPTHIPERKENKESKQPAMNQLEHDHEVNETEQMKNNDPELCSICQDKFDTEEKVQTLDCGHKFHEPCIQKWIEVRNLCPLCKQVADTSRPVNQLSSDDEHLTTQLIQSILSTSRASHNMSSLNFWQNMIGSAGDMSQHNSPTGSLFRLVLNGSGPFSQSSRRNNNSNPSGQIVNMINAILNDDDDDDMDSHQLRSSIFSSSPQVNQQPLQQHPQQPLSHQLPPPPPPPQPSISLTAIPDFHDRVRHLRHQRQHDPDLCDEQAQCSNCAVISCKHAILRCSQCHQIRYCSRQCQNQHWNEHKEWCILHNAN